MQQICLTLRSKTCCLEFFQLENNLEDSISRITVLSEEEEVAKKQIAEDMSLYGSRPHPPDAFEINEHTQPSNLPPKRGAAEFEAAVNRPSKVRRTMESKELNYQGVTAMDWNSGATPLDAWLNQSAVPSIVPLPRTSRNQSGSPSDDLAAKELEGLKVFRTIHIEGIEEPKSIGSPRNSVIDLTIHNPRTQIYLRNILDRYPLLPSYLALRLAKANCARADRLDRTRHNCGDQLISKPVQISGRGRPPPSKGRTSVGDVAQSSKPLGSTQDGMNPNFLPPKTDNPRRHTCATCNRCFARSEHLKRHERSHTEEKPITCEQCTRRFSRRDLLLRHQEKVHMTSPPSCEFRYHVTLDAPTATNRQGDETPVTYVNKRQTYTLEICDRKGGPQSIGFFRYRTVVRISFDDELERQDPSASWQLWNKACGLEEAHLYSGKLRAIEYVALNLARYKMIGKPSIELEAAFLDSFSVTWGAPGLSAGTCSIQIQFSFLPTDFGHYKGVKSNPVRLYAKTEPIWSSTPNLLLDPTAEICFCKINLLKDQDAKRAFTNGIPYIKNTIEKLEQQLALMENDDKDIGSASKGANPRRCKILKYKQTLSASSQGVDGQSAAEDDLHTKLAKFRHMLLSIRPISVLNAKGGERDDPDDFPVFFPRESRFRQQRSSRTACMICCKSHYQLEDCPYRKPEYLCWQANADFWTVRGSRSRAASVQSSSSERNNSLHGSDRLDVEDQDLSFLDDRSRRSSASFSESSATFPPPPVDIERERYPPADAGKEIMDQAPRPLRFFCDICEQEIEVLRRRDWQ